MCGNVKTLPYGWQFFKWLLSAFNKKSLQLIIGYNKIWHISAFFPLPFASGQYVLMTSLGPFSKYLKIVFDFSGMTLKLWRWPSRF